MLLNNKGFILVEVLIGFSLLVTVVTTIVPLTVLIDQERKVLSERRTYASVLHDELQHYIWKTSSALENIDGFTIDFNEEGNLIRGCISWENVKQQIDEICLYGLSER